MDILETPKVTPRSIKICSRKIKINDFKTVKMCEQADFSLSQFFHPYISQKHKTFENSHVYLHSLKTDIAAGLFIEAFYYEQNYPYLVYNSNS